MAETGELLSYCFCLNRQFQMLEQSLGSGRGAGGLEWNCGEKRLGGGERRQELGV